MYKEYQFIYDWDIYKKGDLISLKDVSEPQYLIEVVGQGDFRNIPRNLVIEVNNQDQQSLAELANDMYMMHGITLP
jgi:hypothetical protein